MRVATYVHAGSVGELNERTRLEDYAEKHGHTIVYQFADKEWDVNAPGLKGLRQRVGEIDAVLVPTKKLFGPWYNTARHHEIGWLAEHDVEVIVV